MEAGPNNLLNPDENKSSESNASHLRFIASPQFKEGSLILILARELEDIIGFLDQVPSAVDLYDWSNIKGSEADFNRIATDYCALNQSQKTEIAITNLLFILKKTISI